MHFHPPNRAGVESASFRWALIRQCLALILFLLLGGTLHAQQDMEGSVPSNWAATSGTLSISPNHYKMGTQSLRWDWTAGSVLTITSPGITAADVTNTSKGTCDFWMWNGTAQAGTKLKVEFMNGATPQYWFDFYLGYTGWRHAVRSYIYDMSKKASPSSTFTSVRITAPATGSGSFYFDAVRWVGDSFTRIRDAQNPDITGTDSGTLEASTFALVPDIAATTPTAAELSELATIRSRWITANKGSSAPAASSVTAAGTSFADLNIVEDANGVRGDVIGITLGSDPAIVEDWAITLARDYVWGTSTATDSRDKMMQLIRHFLDQAQAANSDQIPTGGGPGYDFVDTPNALVLMASACDAATKQQLFDYYRWIYWMGDYWKPPFAGANTDDIYLESVQELGAILFFAPNDTEAVRQLKGYKRYMERFLAFTDGKAGGIKVDGLGFHHYGHYNNYMYAYKSLTDAIYQLRGTSFQINQTAYENFRLAVFAELRMSAFNPEATSSSNFGYFANSLCGRKPFTTNVQYRQVDLQHLGELGGYFYGQSADSVVARAYNRRYGVNNYALFTPYGVEASPDGFYQFNYSPLGIYRRANWVASMRAPQSYYWSAEIYPGENAYGRYQSYGALEILYDGGRSVSGQQINGWDWNQPPGTTTIVLPNSKLLQTGMENVRSQLNFSGALAFHDGQSGVYGGNFQEANLTNHNPTFVWRKSWFAFDSEIVCLGSNIANNDSTNSTVTTLFQGALATQSSAITLDDSAITSFPYSATASASSAHWLLDSCGTGYLVQSGSSVKISRATQVSPNHNATATTTSGDFAKAWIDHGAAPSNAGYEYAVFPGTTSAAMSSAAVQHANSASKPYEVIQRDSTAHAVKWKADGKMGYSIFTTSALPTATKNAGLLSAVQRPCLVMCQYGSDDDAWLSVVDPDLNFMGDVSTARTLDLTVNGSWSLTQAVAGVSIASSTATSTVVRVTTQHGLAVHVHLKNNATAGTSPWANIGSDWNNPVNWSGVLPADDTTTDIAALGTATVQPVLNNAYSVKGLTTAGGTTLSGTGNLTVGASGIAATGSTNTISIANLKLAVSQAWNIGAGTLTVSSAIDGQGGATLTKTGAGTLTLSGANTNLGGTILAGGKIALSGSANVLPDNSNVIFQDLNAVLVLNSSNETVTALYFGNAQQAAGTWGATGSGATNIDNVRFSGPGVLTVTSGPTFGSWMMEQGLSGSNASVTADPNNNGIKNGIEFVLGGKPGTAGDMPPLPTHQMQGNNVIFTFRRADIAAPLNPVVEFATNVAGPWTPAQNGVNATIQVVNGTPFDTVTVTIPKNGATKMFVRLSITSQ